MNVTRDDILNFGQSRFRVFIRERIDRSLGAHAHGRWMFIDTSEIPLGILQRIGDTAAMIVGEDVEVSIRDEPRYGPIT